MLSLGLTGPSRDQYQITPGPAIHSGGSSMVRHLRFWSGPLLGLVFLLTVGSEAADTKKITSKDPNVKDGPKEADAVCPLYKWADYGTYQSWYALKCKAGTPVNLNTPANWAAAACESPGQPIYC